MMTLSRAQFLPVLGAALFAALAAQAAVTLPTPHATFDYQIVGAYPRQPGSRS